MAAFLEALQPHTMTSFSLTQGGPSWILTPSEYVEQGPRDGNLIHVVTHLSNPAYLRLIITSFILINDNQNYLPSPFSWTN